MSQSDNMEQRKNNRAPASSTLSEEIPDNELDAVVEYKKFDDVPGLKQEIKNTLFLNGFERPIGLQNYIGILTKYKHNNFLCASDTGTGKTLSYLIPVLNRIDPTIKRLQAVIVAPTKELVRQIYEQLVRLIASMSDTTDNYITVAYHMGGTNPKHNNNNFMPHKTDLMFASNDPNIEGHGDEQIVVGTVTRICGMFGTPTFAYKHMGKKRFIKLGAECVSMIVVDECDTVIESSTFMGALKEMHKYIDCQKLLVSATVCTSVDTNQFASHINCTYLSAEDMYIKQIDHYYLKVNENDKIDATKTLLSVNNFGSAFIFVQNQNIANYVYEELKASNFSVGITHGSGSLNNQRRMEIMDEFRNGTFKILITTDVLAKGIDVITAEFIIHYNIENMGADLYTHRTGRASRLGQKSYSVMYVPYTRSNERPVMVRNLSNAVCADIKPIPNSNLRIDED